MKSSTIESCAESILIGDQALLRHRGSDLGHSEKPLISLIWSPVAMTKTRGSGGV